MTDMRVVQGDDFSRRIDIEIAGEAADLSNWQFSMQARRKYHAAQPLFSISSGNGISVDGNSVWLYCAAAETSQWPAGNYYYDLEYTSQEKTGKLLRGNFIVEPEVTRIETA